MKYFMKRDNETIRFYRKRLPHWEVRDGLYFVTLRQADSLPVKKAEEIRCLIKELDAKPEDERDKVRRLIFRRMEAILDCGYNGRLTLEPYVDIIIKTILHRHEQNIWRMVEFVIMPNHLHLFFENNGRDLEKVLKDFKIWTIKEFRKQTADKCDILSWQTESFDHWSRTVEEDEKIIKYIRNNPVKAKLANNYQDWKYGGWNCLK
ncbi:MAG: transposase [Victivallales bacterium]